MTHRSEAADTTDKRTESGWLERLLVCALLLACALAMSKCLADPDLWGHARYGADLLRDGPPAAATYTYTASDQAWINHEHLSEIGIAVGATLLGGAGLLAIKGALAILIMFRLWQRSERAGAARTTTFLLLLLAAANLMHFWSLRPQLATFLCFFGLLELLDREPIGQPAGWRRPLMAGVPLMLLWANAHGGFVAGLVVAALFLGVRTLQTGLAANDASWRSAVWSGARNAAVMGVLCLATLANPYGWRLHAWLLESLGRPRPEIVEWLPPEILTVAWAPFWLTVLLTVTAWTVSRRPRDFAQAAVIAALLFAATQHRRHIALFALAFGYWSAPHLDDLLKRMGAGADERPLDATVTPTLRPWAGLGLTALCLLLVGAWISQSYRIPVRRDGYPVAALQYIEDQGLHGRMIARFKWAQYALASFADRPRDRRIELAFDGRFRTCYSQEMVDMYFDFALGDDPTIARAPRANPGRPRPERLLEYRSPELVLIGRDQATPSKLLAERADVWTLLYQDEVAELWGRSEVFANPASDRYLAKDDRLACDDPQIGSVAWPAFPNRRPTRLARRP